jgi:S-adenosylmethionine:tRNA ribosyltransferase-isomerase
VTSDYIYALPEGSIALIPAEPADESRLMFVGAGGGLEHHRFLELPELLRPSDLLVINETRVIRARLRGTRAPGGGVAEILLLRPLDRSRYDSQARRWEALVRPARRLGVGKRVAFGEDGFAEVVGVRLDAVREVVLDLRIPLPEFLERHGEMPLPPYVGEGDELRAARYQTMFARVPGSVAAPTASLHFTPRVFEALRARGIEVVALELDVGYGTFKPIETERLEGHVMHSERYAISEASARAIDAAHKAGRRVVAAGTTVLRALESAAVSQLGEGGALPAGERETNLFIMPGYNFKIVDVLLTNFHLPASTLLVLVATFAGYERAMDAYRVAIAEGYRFYSFGDAMLIERGTT